ERPHYRHAQWALQPKDWLRLRLIHEAATEPSDASGTLLYDMTTDYWAKDVLSELDLRLDFLAPIRESVEICGVLAPAAAAHLGVRPNLPVVGGAADTAAAEFPAVPHRRANPAFRPSRERRLDRAGPEPRSRPPASGRS